MGDMTSLPEYRLMYNVAGVFRGQMSEYIRGYRWSRYTLEELLQLLTSFKASRAHDTIYAILGLASDLEAVHPVQSGPILHGDDSILVIQRQDTISSRMSWHRSVKQFEVDYNLPALAVFKTFLYHAMYKFNSLDIICWPWAPTSGLDAKGNQEEIELPTCIPGLSRHNVDAIPPDECWRVLVADRSASGHEPDRWYPLVFHFSAQERGLEYGFETSRLITGANNAAVVEVFRRMQAVVWNRRLIRAQGSYMSWLTQNKRSRGALGLAPDDTREGDLICIIFGYIVPLILRIEPRKFSTDSEVIAKESTSEEQEEVSQNEDRLGRQVFMSSKVFTVVGECYIDHMMDGKAIVYWEENHIQSETFKLE